MNERWRRLLGALLATVSLGALAESTDAEVRKVDRAQARITLKHGEIRQLDLPPMTMVFRVRDARLLDGIGPGDRVRVEIARIDGQYTVVTLVKSP